MSAKQALDDTPTARIKVGVISTVCRALFAAYIRGEMTRGTLKDPGYAMRRRGSARA